MIARLSFRPPRRRAPSGWLLGLAGQAMPVVMAVALQVPAGQDSIYHPGPGDAWQRRPPATVGMNARRLQEAITYANAHETTTWPRGVDLRTAVATAIANEPFNEIVGPTKARGGVNGIILRHGYIVAEWGETTRVDMLFSVSKSFISTVAGLAWDRGVIRDVHHPVSDDVPSEHFDSPHNVRVTWDQMLRQTSGWEGILWGKPDWADRFEGERRGREEPGARWRYNDVRVNLLALALLNVWRRPLPEVLAELVMDPIGASSTWRWHGYENSWVVLDGLQMQSVAGGGHWGGGMWMSTRDLARLGLLYLRRGAWRGQTLLSDRWIEMATPPTATNPTYGYMNWWLNTDRQLLPSAPETSFYATGGSSNRLYVDREHDVVIAVRWIDGSRFDGVVKPVLESITR